MVSSFPSLLKSLPVGRAFLTKAYLLQVKQIAGRAGRRNTSFAEGTVTTFYEADIKYLVDGLQQPLPCASSAGLAPVFEQVPYLHILCFFLLSRLWKKDSLHFPIRWNYFQHKFLTIPLPKFSQSKYIA